MPEAEDTQLEIKKRARRRLVGAIALSLFAAIVFPLVMDNDPGPMVQDIEIRIPGQNDRSISNRLALQPPPDEAPGNPPAAEPSSPPSAATEPTATITPKQAQTESVAATIPAAAEKPAPTQRVETKRAQDILSAKPPAAHEKSPALGQFVILIGAFSNEGNVKVLRKKLDEVGLKSFTEPFGEKTRVRAGPFPNRETAEKALQKMKTIGVTGQIASK